VRVRLNRATIDGEAFVVAEIRDITAEKERERELERQNERLDRFASMVSHDLRNPLQVAQERLAAAREDTDSPHFENIARAHDRMEDIIAETLTLARQGETVDDLEALDLNETIERWWTDSDTDGATLETERLPTVLCDAGRLRHVFENLFRNAVEHGSTSNRTASDDAVEHGSPTPQANGDGPATPTVRVGSLPDGVYVEDDGPGIPPEDRDRVTDAGHTTADDNTGFGLTIVEQIVDAHGWELTITDGEDGGARFEITGVRTV
jgi:signal transduction histidine kinase